jgi:hypothetical protein
MNPDPYLKRQGAVVEAQIMNNMDYSYFPPQPYQFLGLPPTPSHTNNINSDEFSNESPPVCPRIACTTIITDNHYSRILMISSHSMSITTTIRPVCPSLLPLNHNLEHPLRPYRPMELMEIRR